MSYFAPYIDGSGIHMPTYEDRLEDALLAAVKNTDYVWDARLYVNDTDATDSDGIPSHSLAMVVEGGVDAQVAQAIWDKKAPGIGTWGSTTANARDGEGNPRPVSFTQCDNKMIFIYPFVRVLPGGSQDAIRAAVIPAIVEFVNSRGIGEDLNIPQLYGIAYASDPSIANTYIITDIQVSTMGASSTVRDLVPCAWNEKITTVRNGGVNIRFS